MGSTGQSITLANSIIGVGILAMPFCFQQCGVLLATLILLFMGLVSRLCCYFLLKSALIARRRNFEFLAFHVFGSAGKFAVEVGIIGFLMGTCIAYFVVVGDLGPQIVAKMFNINQSDILRTSIMVIVSLVCVIPLGLLRNVDSLGNVSAATIGFYFCLVIKVIAEATSQLLAGAPARVAMWRPAGLLQCVPIFSMALFCQTQLFEIFESLPSLSLEKMNVVTKNAIHICTAVYFTLGLFGYIAFSAQDISGNILMSLSPTMASDVIKLGFVMSVACSFPLIIFPCRASLYSLLYKKVQSSHHDHIVSQSIPPRSFRLLTVCIVAAALCVSLLLPNIELVLGLLGSSVGVLVCVVFPAAAFVTVTFKNTNERLLAKAVIVLGLIIMVLGTCANLQAAGERAERYDESYITKERIDQIVEDFFHKMDKSDDVMAKPDKSKDEDSNKIDNDEIIKESVALPPNPVPPESQSHEKEHSDNGAIKPIPVVKKVTEAVNNVIDKVSETHPKNLNKGNEAKIANGKNKDIVNIDKPKEEIKPQSNDDKINMLKQKQLIETIKQHGEEQKELIKEQKEILTEIKKTQKELQKTKNEAADADAKKLAVESIKQIANMAIQSLAGVSDKPGQIMDEKKSEQLEKLADDAVHEIAQKAVETIEAIKEIKDKPEQAVLPNVPQVPVQPILVDPVQNIIQMNDNLKQNVVNPSQAAAPNNVASSNVNNGNQVHNKVKPRANVNAQPNKLPAGNVLPVQNVQQQPNVAQPAVNVPQPAANVPQPAANVPQPVGNVPQSSNIAQPPAQIPPVEHAVQPSVNVPEPEVNNNAQPVANVQPNKKNEPAANIIPDANVRPVVNQNNNAQTNQILQNIANANQQAAQNNIKPIQSSNQHLHYPDEPQSYKQGEDTQNTGDKIVNNVARNVPLPLAMNGNSKTNEQKANEQLALMKEVLNNNINQNNGVPKDNNKVENVPGRQKREVVDCAEKSTLQPEDKEICKTLMGNPALNTEIKDSLSSNVDLSSMGLPKDLPMYQNAIHHISRSLKMVEEANKNER